MASRSMKSLTKNSFGEDPKQYDKKIKNIVLRGRLVEAPQPPETFYRGWYPVRSCRYDEREEPRLGMSLVGKTMSFRGDRVACEICDRQPPIESASGESCKTTTTYKLQETKRNVAEGCTSNTHWRFHDPHHWMDKSTIPANTIMHQRNWFNDQIQGDLTWMKVERENRRRERYAKMKAQEHLDYKAAMREAQQKLKEQQKKCAFNNPVEYDLPPLPGPPETAIKSRVRTAAGTPSRTPVDHEEADGDFSRTAIKVISKPGSETNSKTEELGAAPDKPSIDLSAML